MPALPLDEAGKYVAAAYVVFLGLILVYVAIMATKLARIARDVEEIHQLVEAADERPLVPAGGEARGSESERP